MTWGILYRIYIYIQYIYIYIYNIYIYTLYPDVSWYYFDEKQSLRFSSNNLLWCLDAFCQFHLYRSCIYFCDFCDFYAHSSEPWHTMHDTWWSSAIIAGTKLPPRKQKHKRQRQLWQSSRFLQFFFYRHVQWPNAMRKSTQERQRDPTFSFLETLTSNYFPGVFSFLHCNSCQCSRDFCSSLEASCISKKSTFHVLPTMQATEVASLQLSLAHAADEDCCAAPVSKIHMSAVSRFEMFHKKL